MLRLVRAGGRLEPIRRGGVREGAPTVCRRSECAEGGLARKGFERSLRGPVIVDQETLDFITEWQRNASTR